MKLAILSSQYPKIGTPYSHMFVHMRSLEFLKNDIDLVVLVSASQQEEYIYDNVKVKKLPSKQIIKHLQSFDLVYLHLLHQYPLARKDGWKIYKYILKKNIPFAMFIHGNEVQKYTRRFYNFDFSIKQLLIWLKKDLIVIPRIRKFIKQTKDRNNSSFIFPSKWMKDEAEFNLGYRFEKYHIIPNGIDTLLFKKIETVENRYKLITVRSLSEKVYNIKFTIDVLKYLPEQFTLDIYGRGRFLKEYEKYIEKLDLRERVKIIPKFIERNDMNKLFSNYGIFISTTKTDSQGVTMLEAMASGLLTICTNNTSKPEFIKNGKTGILGTSPKEMAQRIVDVTYDSSVFEDIVNSGRKSMLEIDIRKTVQKEIDVLGRLIQ